MMSLYLFLAIMLKASDAIAYHYTWMTSLYPFLAIMSTASDAMLLPSTAITRFAPARAQKRDKMPVPAPTSITTASFNEWIKKKAYRVIKKKCLCTVTHFRAHCHHMQIKDNESLYINEQYLQYIVLGSNLLRNMWNFVYYYRFGFRTHLIV